MQVFALALLLALSRSVAAQDLPRDPFFSLLSLEVWVVLAVIGLVAIITLLITWIIFCYCICDINKRYYNFVKSLKRNRKNQQRRVQDRPQRQRRPAPMAITYRTNPDGPRDVYVSLAQLAAAARNLQLQTQDQQRTQSAHHPYHSPPHHPYHPPPPPLHMTPSNDGQHRAHHPYHPPPDDDQHRAHNPYHPPPIDDQHRAHHPYHPPPPPSSPDPLNVHHLYHSPSPTHVTSFVDHYSDHSVSPYLPEKTNDFDDPSLTVPPVAPPPDYDGLDVFSHRNSLQDKNEFIHLSSWPSAK